MATLCTHLYSSLLTSIIVFFLLLTPAYAKTENAPSDKPTPLELTGRTISSIEQHSDEQIVQRITDILLASGQFSALEVKSDHGLVSLRGTSENQEFISWAADLSKHVDGVVAVANKLELAAGSYISLDPVKSESINLWVQVKKWFPNVVLALAVFIIFMLIARFTPPLLVKQFHRGSNPNASLALSLVKKGLAIFIIILGIYFFLRLAGLTQIAVALISGTGVAGIILGFALRDIAENFISGILLSIQKPFRLEDVIEVTEHTGVVRKMTTRATTIIDFDGNHIVIPNSSIYKNIIRNFTANPKMRTHFTVGIGYDASIKRAQELALEAMSAEAAILDDPEPMVLIDNLGSSTVNLKLYFWVDAHQYSTLKVASKLMRIIIRAFESNGISMPDDAREVVFPNGITVVTKHEPAPTPDTDVAPAPATRDHEDLDPGFENLNSEAELIKKQAASSRDPNEGKNLI